ncbi:MAG: undecaprenyl/decaprenyl-phosphate alpha-N-acetylglucosaminyl 1-phosphate transferase [Muribaculaceae bacterium]|nr:undecaprenyl/decaprenyl-phosphate alpha-N-acetylglucosaminyl 1-phosphate transferase [Muribaculaceae bacterium]
MSLAFAISFLVTWFLIPRIISFAFKKQLFDYPDERKIHHGSVPRLGGVAFFPVTLFAITMVTVLSVLMWGDGDIDEITPLQHGGLNLTQHGVQLTFGLCAALILYVFGIADDLKGVRYRNKFIAQIVAGALLCMSGLWLKDLHGIVGLHAISPWIGWPLTIFAIVFITNAINFIDGIDGLASSLCSIALIYFAVGFCVIEHYDYALLAITVLGALLPFLWYNVHGRAERHNKIFMGDTGSLFLGFLLGALGVAFNNNVAQLTLIPNPMALAFAPMIVPCFDVLRVVMHRVRHGASPFKPDKNHIHHKLLKAGLGQHQVLSAVVGLSITAIVLTLALSYFLNINYVLLIDIAVWMVFNIWLTRRGDTHRQKS